MFFLISVSILILYIIFLFGFIIDLFPHRYILGSFIEVFAILFPLIILSTIFLLIFLLNWMKSLADKKIELDIEKLESMKSDE